MKIIVQGKMFKAMCDALPEDESAKLQQSNRYFNDNDKMKIDIASFSDEALKKLLAFLDANTEAGGRSVVLSRNQVQQWMDLKESPDGDVKVSKLENFVSALRLFMEKNCPNRYLFRQNGDGNLVPVLVTGAVYHESRSRDDSPPYVEITTCYLNYTGESTRRNSRGDVLKKDSFSFGSESIFGKKISEVLSAKGYYVESENRMKSYAVEFERFAKLRGLVGLQVNVTGKAYAIDNSWWGSRSFVPIERNGEPVRAVLDPVSVENSSTSVEAKFWQEDGDVAEKAWPVPTQVYLQIFDLEEHSFYAAHVNNVTEYEYKTNIGNKLILPSEVKELLEVLITNAEIEFQDIVAGKAGGMIVLCQGVPGTGKTLTSEVYSEQMKRPLYKVQASQLGISIEDLEKTLKEVLERAERWHAILLLDEADVYVRARGNEIEQNAIVGVFLRVLEYYRGVLFMTTNRGTEIDDAIVSRLTARVTYSLPNEAERAKIWKMLAFENGLSLSETLVSQLCDKFPETSGRDIKNILKLAKLVSAKDGYRITFDLIKRLMKFKQ